MTVQIAVCHCKLRLYSHNYLINDVYLLIYETKSPTYDGATERYGHSPVADF